MAAYLISCSCGKKVPVEVGQAGGRVACSCGNQLDVPPLRQLRHLPQEAVAAQKAGGTWNVRQGATAACGIFAVLFAALGLWYWWTTPTMPKFDPVAHLEHIDAQLKVVTPAESWRLWTEYYRPLAERGALTNADQIEREIAHRRFVRGTLWTVGAIFAALAAATAFWPQQPPRRV